MELSVRAFVIGEKTLGPGHPGLATQFSNRGWVVDHLFLRMGNPDCVTCAVLRRIPGQVRGSRTSVQALPRDS